MHVLFAIVAIFSFIELLSPVKTDRGELYWRDER